MLFNLGGFYMKYCSKCGAELHDDAVVCTQCGCQVKEMVPEESLGLGIAAIVFSVLGGWLGLLLSIIGRCVYKTPRNKKYCKIGLGICIAWIVIWVIIFIVAAAA